MWNSLTLVIIVNPVTCLVTLLSHSRSPLGRRHVASTFSPHSLIRVAAPHARPFNRSIGLYLSLPVPSLHVASITITITITTTQGWKAAAALFAGEKGRKQNHPAAL